MNFHTIKVWLSKLISNLVLGLNAACGVLLEEQPAARTAAKPVPAQQPVLRVVRGGRAA